MRSNVRAAAYVLGLAACGGGDTPATTDASERDMFTSVGDVIGPGGGYVYGDGVVLTIPFDAVSYPTRFWIVRSYEQVAGAASPVYWFHPREHAFEVPAEVTFDVEAAGSLSVFWATEPGTVYDELPSESTSPTSVTAEVTRLGAGYVAPRR